MTSVAEETKGGEFREVIRIDEDQLKGHVAEVVRQSVEETLVASVKLRTLVSRVGIEV
jgi:hypothetical protein